MLRPRPVGHTKQEEPMLLAGRVAFVTGAGSGQRPRDRRAFAVKVRVWPASIGIRSGGRTVTGLACDRGRGAAFVHGDVRVAADVEQAIEAVVARAGRIDAVVNCAGVREIGDDSTMPTEEWTTSRRHLSGVFYCCQSAARRMERPGRFDHEDLLSRRAIGLSHRPAYTAAKHGVVGLTKSFAPTWRRTASA